MPFRCRYRRFSRSRRRYRRAKPRYTTWGSAKHLASKALSAARYVRSVLNVEHKSLETVMSTALDATGDITHLSAIPQDSTDHGRNGNSVKATSWNCRYTVGNLGVSGPNAYVRLGVIEDTQQAADTAPTLTEIFGGSYDVRSMLNPDTLGRFRILWDKTFALDTISGGGTVSGKKYIKLNHHIRYNGTNGSDIARGGLYCFRLADVPFGTVANRITGRLSYVDN